MNNNSKQYRLLKKFFKHNFERSFMTLFKTIVNNYEKIHGERKINVNELLQGDDLKYFMQYHTLKINETGDLQQYITNEILEIIDDYYMKYETNVDVKESDKKTEETYEEDEDGNVIPNENFTFSTFLDLMSKDEKRNFIYNKYLKSDNYGSSNLSSVKIEVLTPGYTAVYPVKFKATCKRICIKNGQSTVCNNVVYFNENYAHSQIKCCQSFNLPTITAGILENAHTMQNLTSAQPEKFINLYQWFVNIYDLDGNKLAENEQVFSLEPFNHNFFTANIFNCRLDKQNVKLILGYASVVNKDYKKIFTPELRTYNDKNFLSVIYDGIREYYKNYHGIVINNKNRIVGQTLVFIGLANIYFNERFNAFFLGTSGSGKTFLAKNIFPLLTTKYVNTIGTSVTRNAFIGGQSDLKSLGKSSFKIGYIGTQDIIVCEEASNALDNFQNPKIDNKDNLFSMLKNLDGTIDVGIQGSRPVTPVASVILFGNTEQLNVVKEYEKNVRKQYYKFSNGQPCPNNKPLYAQVEWYKDFENNEILAKTHAFLRKDSNWVSGDTHYVTKLPPAEMSRFTFFNVLEDRDTLDEDNVEPAYKLDLNSTVHNTEFRNELDEIFKDKNIDKEELKILRKELNIFLNNYIHRERNNYKILYSKHINTRTYNNLFNMCAYFIIMQKLFFNMPIKFTDDDKVWILQLLRYNYNVLDREEAQFIKQPCINDTIFENMGNEEIVKNAEYVKSLKNKDNVVMEHQSIENLQNILSDDIININLEVGDKFDK